MIYRIIEANDPTEFVVMINKSLSEGWKLQGGVSYSEPPYHYVQALFKDREPGSRI